jgi:hypothetical protein
VVDLAAFLGVEGAMLAVDGRPAAILNASH